MCQDLNYKSLLLKEIKMNLNKINKIIYPAYNGTNGFFKTPRWDIVAEDTTYHIYDYSIIRTIEILRELK
jgi:hypothetical protein